MTPEPKTRNGDLRSGIGELMLKRWYRVHPTISDFLSEVEKCPTIRGYAERILQPSAILQTWLDHWKSEGRPEIKWPHKAGPIEGAAWIGILSQSYWDEIAAPNI